MADLQEMPGGVDTAELQNRAYQGADEGSGAFSRIQDQGDSIESLEVAYILRPQVAMGYLEGLPYVVSLGICEALDRLCADEMRIGWPYAVVHDTKPLVSLETHAGYGKGGIFAVAQLTLPLKALDEGTHACALLEECRVQSDLSDRELAATLRDEILSALRGWEQGFSQGGAGPLAPVLNDYFDVLDAMGERVEIRYPNGRLKAQGRFAGVDVWGRASVVADDGSEISFSHEEASMRLPQH